MFSTLSCREEENIDRYTNYKSVLRSLLYGALKPFLLIASVKKWIKHGSLPFEGTESSMKITEKNLIKLKWDFLC